MSEQPKARPILFSAPMVRAILEGRKTQTRRSIKPPRLVKDIQDASVVHPDGHGGFIFWFGAAPTPDGTLALYPNGGGVKCPYGKPGDRLWVRETWAYETHALASKHYEQEGPWVYAADNRGTQGRLCDRWRPSIHMFRAASRITLEIVSVRVERLNAISEADAIAEGIRFTDFGRKCGHTGKGWTDVGDCPAPDKHHPQRNGWHWEDNPPDHNHCHGAARWAYANLWESINGPGSFDDRWVWVIEFEVVPCPT